MCVYFFLLELNLRTVTLKHVCLMAGIPTVYNVQNYVMSMSLSFQQFVCIQKYVRIIVRRQKYFLICAGEMKQ